MTFTHHKRPEPPSFIPGVDRLPLEKAREAVTEVASMNLRHFIRIVDLTSHIIDLDDPTKTLCQRPSDWLTARERCLVRPRSFHWSNCQPCTDRLLDSLAKHFPAGYTVGDLRTHIAVEDKTGRDIPMRFGTVLSQGTAEILAAAYMYLKVQKNSQEEASN